MLARPVLALSGRVVGRGDGRQGEEGDEGGGRGQVHVEVEIEEEER